MMKLTGHESFHFIGVGGIGMSALAQMYAAFGCRVTGSDRGADKKENQIIIESLRRQGIKIFAQDGSFMQEHTPDYLVYSSAIEEDNADFAAAPNVARLHRAEALGAALDFCSSYESIAVTGSCGKSSVTGYMAEALIELGDDPICLNGALCKRFQTFDHAGNFRMGRGRYFVFEADESDKSLLRYTPDYAMVLNIGTDHYDKEELARVFGEFLSRVRKGAVLERQVYELVRDRLSPSLPVAVFDSARPADKDAAYGIADYRIYDRLSLIYRDGRRERLTPDGSRAASDRAGLENYLSICGMPREDCRVVEREALAELNDQRVLHLPQTGYHMALNALAITAMLDMLGFDRESIPEALRSFHGIWRRQDYAGVTASGAAVYDDYAHNPEKIAGCLKAAQENGAKRIFAVFQPHGFGPFGFMRDELFLMLEQVLRRRDEFILLPPFYAGGTSSFKPTAEEVRSDWKARGNKTYLSFPDRDTLRDYIELKSGPEDLILIMGARDNSLSDYARSLTCEKKC